MSFICIVCWMSEWMSVFVFQGQIKPLYRNKKTLELYGCVESSSALTRNTYMISLVYFSVEVCLEGATPHSFSVRQDSCFRVCAPLTLASPSRKKSKIEQGMTQISTWTMQGGIWTDAWVCLHYWIVIWVAGWTNFHLYCTVYGFVIGWIHYGL